MTRRTWLAALPAALVTLAVFRMIEALIAVGGDGPLLRAAPIPLEIANARPDSALERRQRLPEPIRPETPPSRPLLEATRIERPQARSLDIPVPVVPRALSAVEFGAIGQPELGAIGTPGLGAVVSDTEAIPLVRVDPVYPPRALARSLEGHVTVEFTVSPTGRVVEPVVIDSQPERVFDRAALRAIKRWKYRPRVEDGQPVEQRGVRARIVFEIER